MADFFMIYNLSMTISNFSKVIYVVMYFFINIHSVLDIKDKNGREELSSFCEKYWKNKRLQKISF